MQQIAPMTEEEKQVINNVIRAGREYGFGNLIAHLKREWIQSLMETGLDYDAALLAADVEPYQRDFWERLGKQVTKLIRSTTHPDTEGK